MDEDEWQKVKDGQESSQGVEERAGEEEVRNGEEGEDDDNEMLR